MSGTVFDPVQQDKNRIIEQTAQRFAPIQAPQALQPQPQQTQTANTGGGGVLGEAGHLVGEGLHGLGFALNATNKYLAKPLGGLASKGRALLPVNHLNPLVPVAERLIPGQRADFLGRWAANGLNPLGTIASALQLEHMSPEERARVQAAPSLTSAFNENLKDANFVQKLVANALYDPTTYLTGGAGDALLAGREGVMAARLGLGLDVANRIMGAPLEVPLKGAKQLLITRDALGGRNLLGIKAGLEPGKQALFQKAVREVTTGTQEALSKGVNTTDIGNLAGSAERQATATFRDEINRLAGSADPAEQQMAYQKIHDTGKIRNAGAKPETLNTLFKTMQPSEAAYPLVQKEMIDRGYLLTVTTPAQKDVLQPTLTNTQPVAITNAGVKNAITKLRNGDASFADELMVGPAANRTISNERVRAVHDFITTSNGMVKVNGTPTPIDPGNLFPDFLRTNGFMQDVPQTTTFQETQRLQNALAGRRRYLATEQAKTQALRTSTGVVDRATQQLQQQGIQVAPDADQYLRATLQAVVDAQPEHFQSELLWQNPRYQAALLNVLQQPTKEEAQRATVELFQTMNQFNTASGVLHPRLVAILNRILPRIARSVDTPLTGIARHVNNAVVDDLHYNAINEMFNSTDPVLQQAAQEMTKFQDDYIRRYNDIRAMAENYHLGTLTDQTTAQDMNDWLTNGAITRTKDQNLLKKFLKDFDMTPEAVQRQSEAAAKRFRPTAVADLKDLTVQQAYLGELLDQHFKQLAQAYGISDESILRNVPLLRNLAWIPRAWREQALLSPRYHLMNIMDMSVKSLINGINPLRLSGAAQTFASDLQIQPPASVLMRSDILSNNPALAGARAGQQTLSNIPHLGTITDVTSTDPVTTLGRVPVIGRYLDRIVNTNRRTARFLEDGFRLAAWRAGTVDALQASGKEAFYQGVREIAPGQVSADVITDLSRLGNKDLNTLGVKFSAEDVFKTMMDRGASLEQSQQAAQLWSGVVDQASQQGAGLAQRIHFDFDATYAIEDKLHLRSWMPFHFFATRNVPFYLETLAANPQLVHLIADYEHLSDQEKQQMGYPDNIDNMVGIGNNGFLHILFGPGRILVNPMVAVALMDQTKSFDQLLDPQDTGTQGHGIMGLLGNLNTRAQAVGLGVAPWVNIPLDVLGGAYGPGNEEQSLLRVSAPIGAVTETLTGHRIDPDTSIIQPALNRVREIRTGTKRETVTGSLREDRAIANQIAEMAVTEGQGPRDPAYIAASKDPTSNIYQRAKQEVERQMNKDALMGFINPVQTKRVTDVKLQQSQALNNLGITQDDLYSDDPKAQAMVQALRNSGSLATAYQSFGRPKIIDVASGQPIYNGQVSGSGGKGSSDTSYQDWTWGAGEWGVGQPYPFNQPTMFRAYLGWRSYQPPGTDKSPAAWAAHFGLGS